MKKQSFYEKISVKKELPPHNMCVALPIGIYDSEMCLGYYNAIKKTWRIVGIQKFKPDYWLKLTKITVLEELPSEEDILSAKNEMLKEYADADMKAEVGFLNGARWMKGVRVKNFEQTIIEKRNQANTIRSFHNVMEKHFEPGKCTPKELDIEIVKLKLKGKQLN